MIVVPPPPPAAQSRPERAARRILRWLVLAIALPALVGFVAYYGFCTNYTGRVFHEAGFRRLYESGVYKYRVLGRSRESAALVLAFCAAYHWRELRHRRRRHVAELAVLTLAFVATYVGLRLWLGMDRGVYQSVQLARNLQAHSVAGFCLLLLISYAIGAGSRNETACRRFMLACSPYVAAMVVIARPWEIRLWTPIWLGLLVLAHGVEKPPPRPLPREGTARATLERG